MLFGDQNPPDKRDLVEGKLVQLGMRAAELGTNVVFDFGFWGTDERSALRWIAGAVGARSHVLYLPVDHEEQRRRVTRRFAATPDETFHMSDVELEQWRGQFQAPDDEELRGVADSTRSTRARDLVGVGLAALAVLARPVRPAATDSRDSSGTVTPQVGSRRPGTNRCL